MGEESESIPTTTATTPFPRRKLIERFQIDNFSSNDKFLYGESNIDNIDYLHESSSPHQPPKMRLRREFSIRQEHTEVTDKSIYNDFSDSSGNRDSSSLAKEIALSIEGVDKKKNVINMSLTRGC